MPTQKSKALLLPGCVPGASNLMPLHVHLLICLKFAGAVPLTCNRTLIASITNSFSARSHRSHSYAGYSLLSGRPARGSASVSQRRLCCAVALTPRHPSCQLAEARLSPAPAEPRGSAGHAWSAGFDWAAVVVVTGRRRSCGQTVPGAARSLPPPPRPPSPGSPPPARARRRPLPHGLRPGGPGSGTLLQGPQSCDHLRGLQPARPTAGYCLLGYVSHAMEFQATS